MVEKKGGDLAPMSVVSRYLKDNCEYKSETFLNKSKLKTNN